MTSSVGGEPRAYWGAYGSSKAALETARRLCRRDRSMDEIRVADRRSGATRTRMRERAFPGEEPVSLAQAAEAGSPRAILASLAIPSAPTGDKIRVEG